ncbi:MmgE/PrpD family protein [Paracoccus pantotrophus]|uniref:2-methylcitrate dehydratase PrpD n=1 Tax=Paracoccus pantotrophus TaxID=82367 RepID=Q3S8F3_PARPN|nr:MmgE/PrpD family protein [Paracoccus pantotrophus]AAZ93592.1 unknown [Paracoccus pantotrophus]RDD96928.1 MmgE/PrpD family protein [Paracoccus pantotrophus]WGR66599.1 MmgE/PrpD family protein [Paracoccus pantotrophus]
MTMAARGETETAASLTDRFLDAIFAAPVTEDAVMVAGLLVADALAVAVAAHRAKGPRLLLALEGDASGPCPVIGLGRNLPARAAARVNGALIHVLDYEPMWNPANHAISTTLPGLLALAFVGEYSDEAILTALIRGIEAQARLRRASRQFEPGDLVMHPPGVVGPLGSSVACATLLGLDRAQMAMALGISASRAGTILANVGSMTKALHCGGASGAGLEAAELAAMGFTANRLALDGPRGYLRAFFGAACDEAALYEPAPLHVTSPGPAWKLNPAQYGTHFAISAGLDLHAEMKARGLTVADLRDIRITSPHMPYIDRPVPASGLDSKFSLQFAAAVALLDGGISIATYSQEQLQRPELQAVLQKVRLTFDPTRPGRFDQMRLSLQAEFSDGSLLEAECTQPEGSWGRPIPVARLESKIEDCLAQAFPPAGVATLLPRLMALGEVTAEAPRRIPALVEALAKAEV